MKIKLLKLIGHNISDDYYGQTVYTLAQELPWEEISEEDFFVLQEYVLDQNRRNTDTRYTILEETKVEFAQQSLADFVAVARRKKLKKDELKRKQEEKARKRKEKTALREEEKNKAKEVEELALLKTLQDKYGNRK